MEQPIFETSLWKVMLAYDQTYFGRCAAILKRKCIALSDLTDEEMLDLLGFMRKYEALFKEKYGAIMFNWTCLMNDAYKNNPPNPQMHWHGRPRYRNPVFFEGLEFKDPNFAHHYDSKANRELEAPVMEKLREQLRSDLNK